MRVDWTRTLLLVAFAVAISVLGGVMVRSFVTAKRNARGLCARCRSPLAEDDYDVVASRRVCIACSEPSRRAWRRLMVAGCVGWASFSAPMAYGLVDGILERGRLDLDRTFYFAAGVIGMGYPLVRGWRSINRPPANRADPATTPSGVPKALADGQAAEWERQAIRQPPGTRTRRGR